MRNGFKADTHYMHAAYTIKSDLKAYYFSYNNTFISKDNKKKKKICTVIMCSLKYQHHQKLCTHHYY